MWGPPIVLGVVALIGVIALTNSTWRNKLRWRIPAFREASLAQLASGISMMLRTGTTLPEALALAEALEANSPASAALAQWRRQVEAGQGKPAQWHSAPAPFPPMFLWLVQKGGENLSAGFQKAAEIYQGRASYRIEMALYGALPISILLLGQMVFWQITPLFRAMISLMNMLGSFGGD
jgi:type II secretory pathway component PulF